MSWLAGEFPPASLSARSVSSIVLTRSEILIEEVIMVVAVGALRGAQRGVLEQHRRCAYRAS